MKQIRFTRRRLLAGLGAAGALGVGATALPRALGRTPEYSYYTYAAPDSLVRVAWYETYNETFVEATNESSEEDPSVVLDPDELPLYVPEATGPVISLGDLLPGDEGTVALGLAVEDGEIPARVTVYPRLTATDENGRTEPERVAGDRTAVDGELQDAIELTVWRDGSAAGGCDGTQGIGDETVVVDTFQGVSDEYGVAGIDLGCLDPGATRCLGFAWRFDGGNGIQSDSVTFDLAVEAVDCSQETAAVTA